MVIPHVTQCYGDSQDPPEEGVPMCTIRNFPSQIEHCIEWGRVKFDTLFVERPNEIIKYIENSERFLKEVEKGTVSEARTALEKLNTSFNLRKNLDFDTCIEAARK